MKIKLAQYIYTSEGNKDSDFEACLLTHDFTHHRLDNF